MILEFSNLSSSIKVIQALTVRNRTNESTSQFISLSPNWPFDLGVRLIRGILRQVLCRVIMFFTLTSALIFLLGLVITQSQL
jgi:hypothetical protein